MGQKEILGVGQTGKTEAPERSMVIDEGACRATKLARIGALDLGRFTHHQLVAMFEDALYYCG